jgi:hypothetical protein
VSPLEDGGAGVTGPEVAVLTWPVDGRRSITLLEMVGAHVVGGAGVAGVVVGGFGFVLEASPAVILAVMRRSNISIMALILVSCFRAFASFVASILASRRAVRASSATAESSG